MPGPMRSLRALALFAVLTVLLTWPLAANLTVMDAGDSAFWIGSARSPQGCS